MTTAKAKAPGTSKKGSAQHKAPAPKTTTTKASDRKARAKAAAPGVRAYIDEVTKIEAAARDGSKNDIAKGRGRPSLSSLGLSPKRQYVRKVTEDVLAIRRVGEALFGRNWKVDFASAVQYDTGLITRILVGTRPAPEDMAKRIKKAVTEQRKAVTEALKSPLLAGKTTEVALTPALAAELGAIGKAVWGTYFKRDLAAAIKLDPGLMTHAMNGKRAASFFPAELKFAINLRKDALATLRNDPYLTPASPGETASITA